MTVVKSDDAGNRVIVQEGPHGWLTCKVGRDVVGKWLMPNADDKARHEFRQWLDDDEVASQGRAFLDLIDAAVAEVEDRERRSR